MEPKISIVTLGVKDLEKAHSFYRDGLGFPVHWGPEKGIVFYKTNYTVLALYPIEELAKDVSPKFKAEPAKFSGITLAHNVRTRDEVDEILDMAKKAGATIEKQAQETFWGGYSGYFSDLDGHLWEVAHGASEILEDGRLKLE